MFSFTDVIMKKVKLIVWVVKHAFDYSHFPIKSKKNFGIFLVLMNLSR